MAWGSRALGVLDWTDGHVLGLPLGKGGRSTHVKEADLAIETCEHQGPRGAFKARVPSTSLEPRRCATPLGFSTVRPWMHRAA
jgi:hypothetical protein